MQFSLLFRKIIVLASALFLSACFDVKEEKNQTTFDPPAPKPIVAAYASEGAADNFIVINVNPQISARRNGTVDFTNSYYAFSAQPDSRFHVVLANALDQPSFKVYRDRELTELACQSNIILFENMDSANCIIDTGSDETGEFFIVVSGKNTALGAYYQVLVRSFKNEGSVDLPVPLTFPGESSAQVASGRSYYQFSTPVGERLRVKLQSDKQLAFRVYDHTRETILCEVATKPPPGSRDISGYCDLDATGDTAFIEVIGDDLEIGSNTRIFLSPVYLSERSVSLVLGEEYKGSVSDISSSFYHLPMQPYGHYQLIINKSVGTIEHAVIGAYGSVEERVQCEEDSQTQVQCLLSGYTRLVVRSTSQGLYGGKYSLNVTEVPVTVEPLAEPAQLVSEPLGMSPRRFSLAAGYDALHYAYVKSSNALLDMYVIDESGLIVCHKFDVLNSFDCDFSLYEPAYTINLVNRRKSANVFFDLVVLDRKVSKGTTLEPQSVFIRGSGDLIGQAFGVSPADATVLQVENAKPDTAYNIVIDSSSTDIDMVVTDASANSQPLCTSDRTGTVVEKCIVQNVTPPLQVSVSTLNPAGALFHMYVDEGGYKSEGKNDTTLKLRKVLPESGDPQQRISLSETGAMASVAKGEASYYTFTPKIAGSYRITTAHAAEDIAVLMADVLSTEPCPYEQISADQQVRGCIFENLTTRSVVNVDVTSPVSAVDGTLYQLLVERYSENPSSLILPVNKVEVGMASTAANKYRVDVAVGASYEVIVSDYFADVKLHAVDGESSISTLCSVTFSLSDRDRKCSVVSQTGTVIITVSADGGADKLSSAYKILVKSIP